MSHIILPDQHPAINALQNEGVNALTRSQSSAQNPLRIGLVNLMPNVIETEIQYARALANTDQPVELVLFGPQQRLKDARAYINAPIVNDNADRFEKSQHRVRFHAPFTDITKSHAQIDAIIVSGFANENAPLRQSENPAQGIDFYDDFTSLLRWAEKTNTPAMTTCWSAQAALSALHGVRRAVCDQKITGAFNMSVTNRQDLLMRKLGQSFPMPTSRYAQSTESDIQALERQGTLTILAGNTITGASIIKQTNGPMIFMTGHLEYLADTLQKEYLRDRAKMGDAAPRPQNYNINAPERSWAEANAQFFNNLAHHFAAEKRQTNLAPKSQGTLKALRWPGHNL